MATEAVLAFFRRGLGERKPWVLFKHLSVVVIEKPTTGMSLEDEATKIMKKDGPVYPGTPHGDFNVGQVKGKPGWIVTSHSDNLFTYVPPDTKFPVDNPDSMVIGLYGRTKRHEDSQNPQIIHVEHKDPE